MAEECTLTKYQVIGVNWLYLLQQKGLNGILADESEWSFLSFFVFLGFLFL
jgi:hypothetical protein